VNHSRHNMARPSNHHTHYIASMTYRRMRSVVWMLRRMVSRRCKPRLWSRWWNRRPTSDKGVQRRRRAPRCAWGGMRAATRTNRSMNSLNETKSTGPVPSLEEEQHTHTHTNKIRIAQHAQ